MRKNIFNITLAAVLSVHFAYAADLMDVYKQAVMSDPKFQSARAAYLSATQAYPEARSLLLPNLSLTGSKTYNHEVVFDNFFNSATTGNESVDNPQIVGGTEYNLLQYTLTLTQPIINFQNWDKTMVAKAQVKAAAAQYAAAAQDLMLRTATAYFNVLQAEDTLRFTEAEKAATYRELEQAQERYQVGLDAITSVYNAEASYDAIVAREISNKNDILNAREQLREITGVYYQNLATLKNQFPLITPQPNNIDTWVNTAVMQNLSLQSYNYDVIAARENIKVNFAGHLPTFNATADYQRTSPNNQSFAAPSNSEGETAGIQLSLPIYQGGLIDAQTTQAKFDYQKAIADREDIYRQVLVNTRQSFNNIIAGISKIQADRQSIISNRSSVDSTEAALEVGTRTIVDLLNAQQNLFAAQSTLAADQYSYLIETINLKGLAGTLNAVDLMKINRYLAEPTVKVNVSKSNTTPSNYQTTPALKSASISSNAKNYTPAGPALQAPGVNSNNTTTDVNKSANKTVVVPAANAMVNGKANTTPSNNALTTPAQSSNTPKTTSAVASAPSQTAASTNTNSNALTNSSATTNNTNYYYAIEIVGTHTKADLAKFMQEYQLTSANTDILSTQTSDGKTWYSLVYGHYQTEAEAEAAMKSLPASLQKLNPWVHKVME